MNHSHAPAIIDELYTSLCSLFYPGVNSRAELVTLAPGLRPERRFAPLARGQISQKPHPITVYYRPKNFHRKLLISIYEQAF